MSGDVEGWTQVATFEEGTVDDYEEADCVAEELDGDTRAVEIQSPKGSLNNDALLEREVDVGERWVSVATFDGTDPYVDGEPVAESLSNSDEYRVTIEKRGDVLLEKKVGDDE